MKTLLSLLAILAVVGCANIVHKRTVTRIDHNGTNITTETESGRFLFEKEAVSKLSINTRDAGTNYTHSLSATGVAVNGDVELIKAIGDAVGQGIGAAAKGAAK